MAPIKRAVWSASALAFVISIAGAAVVLDAQTSNPPPAAGTPPASTSPPAPASVTEPQVVSVLNVTKAAEKKTKNEEASADVDTQGGQVVTVELKDTLKVRVRHLEAWRKQGSNARTSLVLFLDDVELKNVVAVPAARDVGDPSDIAALLVTVEPQNDPEGAVRKAWVQVLRAAIERDDRPADQQKISVSVGAAGGAAFVSTAEVVLSVWPSYTGWVVAFLIAVAILLIWLGLRSNLLRDSNGAAEPPYSLAKHQMALWFVVVVGSYLYVWLITGFFSSISTTALTVIGISGATGLIAVMVDSNKRREAAVALAALAAEQAALNQTLNDPATGLLAQLKAMVPGSPSSIQLAADLTVKQTRFNELTKVLQAAVPGARQSVRWDKDILSDENGISFHRFQMAIWTLVLVMVFAGAVWRDILMPDFDTTLLGLMGISSSTYLGFKLPEKPS